MQWSFGLHNLNSRNMKFFLLCWCGIQTTCRVFWLLLSMSVQCELSNCWCLTNFKLPRIQCMIAGARVRKRHRIILILLNCVAHIIVLIEIPNFLQKGVQFSFSPILLTYSIAINITDFANCSFLAFFLLTAWFHLVHNFYGEWFRILLVSFFLFLWQN